MVPGEAALEVDGIGLTDGAICGELNGTALHEGTGGHNDIGVIAGHGPGFGGDIAVHGSGGLNALAEGHHGLPATQRHGLNDVMAVLVGGGNAGKAQLFIDIGGEHSALEGTGGHRGRQEQALIKCGHQTQVGTDFLAEAGSGQTIGTALHALLGAADIAADGGETAAGVFDQTAHDHIGAHIGGLQRLHKFTIAVVHHDFHVRLDALAEGNQLANLCHGKRGTGGIALGALNGNQLGALVDGVADGVIVKTAVRLQIGLGICDAVLLQRAGALPDTDDLFQGVIGGTYGGEQFIAGQEVGGEGHSQRMSAAGDLRADQCSLCVEHIGIDLLQIVTACVIVTIAGGGGKVGGVDPVFLHGGQDFSLVVFSNLINCLKAGLQIFQNFFSVFINRTTDAQLFIHRFDFHDTRSLRFYSLHTIVNYNSI